MAFSVTTQWDVRTTGSDANGGGFDTASTGTNYAMQDSAQVAFTDLVIDATTNTKCTSAAHPFTSAHVGNVINITSGTGFTVQRVQVVSVAASVATCDKALGTLSSTGGNGNLGGGLLTFTAANALTTTLGNTINVKTGTYTLTASVTGAAGGGATDTINVAGYGTTWGDNGTKPLITTATNSVPLFTYNRTASIRNVAFSNTAGTSSIGFFPAVSGLSISFEGCKFSGFTDAINGDNAGAHWVYNSIIVNDCEFTACIRVVANFSSISLTSCNIHNNGSASAAGIVTTFGNAGLSVNGCLFTNNTVATGVGVIHNTTNGITLNVAGNTFYSNTGTAMAVISGIWAAIENNIFDSNSGAVWANSGSNSSLLLADRNNAFRNNGSIFPSGFTPSSSDITLTAIPFAAAGSDNYALNSTAGGGAACRGAGYPGVFPGGSSTAIRDIGAVQTSGGGGAAGGLLTLSGMVGGMRG